MGILKIEETELKEMQKSVMQRTTNLSTITSEIMDYFKTNPKAKTLTYDISDYVLKAKESERNAKFRLYASELQNKTRIKTQRVMHNGMYVLIFDKNGKIEQPKQLIGKIGNKGKA